MATADQRTHEELAKRVHGWHQGERSGRTSTGQLIDELLARVTALETALRVIAGEQQCVDNLMSNQDIARAAFGVTRDSPGGTR